MEFIILWFGFNDDPKVCDGEGCWCYDSLNVATGEVVRHYDVL